MGVIVGDIVGVVVGVIVVIVDSGMDSALSTMTSVRIGSADSMKLVDISFLAISTSITRLILRNWSDKERSVSGVTNKVDWRLTSSPLL